MAFAMAFSAFPAYAQGDDGIYRLQIEDLLLVQIFNETQVNAQVPVGQDGNIAAPFVGSVKAAGRTVDELAAELTQLYIQRLRLRDPKVSVTIIRFRELKASVVGAVRQAGSFVIRRGDTVVSLIGRAFGIDSERADPYRATLRRSKSQEQIPIDLFALLYRGDTSQNYEIQDGDELLVPHETKNKVSLLGAIQRPNQYPYRDGMKLSDLIAMGGGEIPRTTMFSKTLVFRPIAGQADQYRVIKSDMVRFFTKGDYSQDILLQPGDLVVINKTKTPSLSDISQTVNSIWIFNLLSKQGLFGFSPF
ncbi:MAG: hypothetical protein A2139_03725 [Desulfobacca sp. RBG_16_60_12]|nr:MAG: hypothetical protein A2139_03725 [Desulfobacca sp. RBG_16_60_12]